MHISPLHTTYQPHRPLIQQPLLTGTACTAECSSRDDCVAIECNDKKLWCEIWHNMPTGSAAMSGYECLAKP